MKRAARCHRSPWLLAVLALGFLATGPVRAEETAAAYEGAARLFSLDSVTVVYPARSAREADVAQRSAERRAAYIQRFYQVPAGVAPDDGLSEEQLNGHLLLLGWDNQLLGTEKARLPYSETRTGRLFLGSIAVGDEEDLIFAAASPYNPEKFLFFWSRIDPELDRFLVLPFVGSDFAVYRDYLAVHQGMFGNRLAWPPHRNSNAEMIRNGEEIRRPPVVLRSEHFTLHGKLSKDDARAILAVRETALAQAAAGLGPLPDGLRIKLFVYEDTEEMESRTGVPDPAYSIPSRAETHMILAMARSESLREEAHILASARYGPTITTALYEGTAVELELTDAPEGLPLYAALLLEHGELPSIDAMLDEESLRPLIRRRVGMPASGLLVRWLGEVGGEELVAVAFRQPGLDTAQLASWLGLSPAETETRFRSWVSMRANSAQAEVEFRRAVGEARALRGNGDSSGAADALVRALAHRPDDPETLYTLGLNLKDAGRTEGAERYLRHLVSLEVEADDMRYVIFGHYQLGQMYDALGRPDEAAACYESVLALPDEHGAHEMAQSALEANTAGSGGGDGGAERP